MTRSSLRLVTVPDLAVDLASDPTIAGRSTITVVSTAVATVRAAVAGRADLVVLRAGSPGAAATAIALRGAGVTVWWIDAFRSTCPGFGAPAVSSTWTDVVGFDQAAEAAARPGAGTAGGPAVSVVVTTLDEGIALDRLVGLVVPQLDVDDELVVVDGGSQDGSVVRVRTRWAHDSRVRLVDAPGAGISAGRNLGVRLARHDVIACTDAGCEVRAGWVDGLRRAFAGPDRPGLVSGTYHPAGTTPIDRAQALSCYPDPHEVTRRDVVVQLYTRVFGTGFHPEFAVGRNVAFTREAWAEAGGFPEHLPTGEDVSFGLAVARTQRCVATADAAVGWTQRSDLRSTWRMYRGYGRASTNGGDVRLLVRDGVRGAAYGVGVIAMFHRRGRLAVALGAAAYLSLPVRRALRSHTPARVYPLLPVAIATKDIGKLAGAVQGFQSHRGAA